MASRRRELIRAALLERLDELRGKRIAHLRPSDFGAHASFVSDLQSQANASSLASHAAHYHQTTTGATGWADWQGDCSQALRELALGKALETYPGTQPPVEPFLDSLYAARRKPDERLHLLMERYSCPLNIALDGEQDVREHLLERLMVQDRAQVESGAGGGVSPDDVLLKLNLLAVYAARGEDLRYLDALNYYYELQERWKPAGPESWLMASYLGLYARALSTWLNQKL